MKRLFIAVILGTTIANGAPYNFYKVDGYKLYRSRQLGYGREKKLVGENGIKLSMTLRGRHPEKAWWQNQKRGAEESRAIFISAEANSDQYPKKHNLLLMLAAIHNPRGVLSNPLGVQQNPKECLFSSNASTRDYLGKEIPIKVNCRFGADRTGMFCALYIIERALSQQAAKKENYPIIKRAQRELSLRYGHIKMKRPQMDRFVKEWYLLRKTRSLKEALEMYKPVKNRLQVNSKRAIQ